MRWFVCVFIFSLALLAQDPAPATQQAAPKNAPQATSTPDQNDKAALLMENMPQVKPSAMPEDMPQGKPSAMPEVVKVSGEKETMPLQKPEKVVVVEEGKAAEAVDALVGRINDYWQASYNRDFAKTYPLYIKAYRDRVELKAFLSHQRADIQNYQIESVSVWGDSCAYVLVRMAMKTEFMDFNKFPTRQVWTLVDGEWFLYENPGGKALFQRKSQQIETPCPLPEALRPKAKNAEKQAKNL